MCKREDIIIYERTYHSLNIKAIRLYVAQRLFYLDNLTPKLALKTLH